MYYNPTPGNGRKPSLDVILRDFGHIDPTSLERFANENCVMAAPTQAWEKGIHPQVVTYNFPLGENWGPTFHLGNYDSSLLSATEQLGFPEFTKGTEAFKEYWTNNLTSISNLDGVYKTITK